MFAMPLRYLDRLIVKQPFFLAWLSSATLTFLLFSCLYPNSNYHQQSKILCPTDLDYFCEEIFRYMAILQFIANRLIVNSSTKRITRFWKCLFLNRRHRFEVFRFLTYSPTTWKLVIQSINFIAQLSTVTKADGQHRMLFAFSSSI